jgi:peptidoglycan LD-endopeptidase CwlK
MAMTWTDRNELMLAPLYPPLAQRVRLLLAAIAVPVLITQGERTWAEQDALYAQGRTAPGNIVTKARSGYSQHNYGLAVDLCPDDPTLAGLQLDWNERHPIWKQMLALAPTYKLAEGAAWRTFPDTPHFYPMEIPATTADLHSHYVVGGQAAVWKWVDSLIAKEVG